MKPISLFMILHLAGWATAQSGSLSIGAKQLVGRWECTNALSIYGTDTTNVSSQYKPLFMIFAGAGEFTESHPAGYTTVRGTYVVKAHTRIITFAEMVQTTTYEWAKLPQPDKVFKTWKADQYVIKLSDHRMVLLDKHTANSEGASDIVLYFKKSK